MKKIINCKTCGAEISKSAKRCPSCGAKNRKLWKILVVGIVAIAVLGACFGGDGNDSNVSGANQNVSQEPISYTKVDADTMIVDMRDNALKASDTYNDADIEVSGMLSNIDSDGAYIDITSFNEDLQWEFVNIQCYITDDAQTDVLMDMSIGDRITVRGHVFDVGEVMGYSININEIVVD